MARGKSLSHGRKDTFPRRQWREIFANNNGFGGVAVSPAHHRDIEIEKLGNRLRHPGSLALYDDKELFSRPENIWLAEPWAIRIQKFKPLTLDRPRKLPCNLRLIPLALPPRPAQALC